MPLPLSPLLKPFALAAVLACGVHAHAATAAKRGDAGAAPAQRPGGAPNRAPLVVGLVSNGFMFGADTFGDASFRSVARGAGAASIAGVAGADDTAGDPAAQAEEHGLMLLLAGLAVVGWIARRRAG